MADLSPPIDALLRLLEVTLVLSVTWLTNFLFGRLIIGAVWKRNRSVAYEVSSVGSIVIWIAGVLLTLPILGASDSEVSVVILLVGAFLILATREFTGNWFAGQTIKKIIPFRVGDWIRASGTYGRVAKIDDLYTTLVTPQNEAVVMPNSKLTSDFILDRSANDFVSVPLEAEIPSGLELSIVMLTMADIARDLSARFSERGENEQPEVFLLSQTAESVKIRVMLKITNPAREEEVKSEFKKKLASLRWPDEPSQSSR